MAQNPQPTSLAADLLRQLHEARSPLARVRVIARAWRTVRSLSPHERMTVAAQLGLEGADDLVEAVAAHQGTTPPPELMKAVNEVQTMDPAILGNIVARIRDPKQRREVVREGFQALGSALAGPPPAPPAPVVTAAPAPKPAPAPPPAPAPAAPVAPVVQAPPPKPAAVQAPPVPVPPAPAAVPVPPMPAPEPPAPVPVRGGLAERLSSTPVLTARFRLLRRRLDDLRRLAPAELRGILEAFPDGWARRRVLRGLIEAGVPKSAADALSLVDVLQSSADRAWCLAALADLRALSADERTAVLQAASTPAVRRRLALRLGDA